MTRPIAIALPSTSKPTRPKIQNPILRGMHPDPTVCRVGMTFYLATSSFGFFPGIPLYASEDLVHWRFIRHILSRKEQFPFESGQSIVGGGIYAPTLRHDGNRFYLVTTNMKNSGNFIVSAIHPSEEWSNPVWIEEAYQGGIDPSLTIISEGRALYQVTADEARGDAAGITQFEIDLETGKGLSPRRHLSSGCGWKSVEGPHLFRRENYWYLLLAEGGTASNHRVTIARSSSEWGPWTSCPHNPILSHCGIQSPVQNTGHADLFDDTNNQWWITFLGVRPIGNPPTHITGRETFITPVEWTPEGWPIVNQGNPASLSHKYVGIEYQTEAPEPDHWIDDFSSAQLHPRWVTLGNAYDTIYELDKTSKLALKATSQKLSDPHTQSFLGTRIDEHQRRYETIVRLSELGVEAGIAVFMDSNGYYSLGVMKDSQGETELRFTRKVLDMETESSIIMPDSDSYTLRVDLIKSGSVWNYRHSEFIFSMRHATGDYEEIGRGTSRLLSSEVIGGFTGLFVGIFCLEKDREHPNPSAIFESFSALQT